MFAGKIGEKLGIPDLAEKLGSLSGSELNTLLLEVMGQKAGELTPAKMRDAYAKSRFFAPSDVEPAAYHRLEAFLLETAEGMGMKGVLLSPAAPFGNCSVFGCVSQNKVISALRGAELLADPTNMLATIIGDGLRRGTLDNRVGLHWCTTARVARAQQFAGKGALSHFGLFAIASSGKDVGSYGCEKALLGKQLEYYRKLAERAEGQLSVALRMREGYTDSEGFVQRMAEYVRGELPGCPIWIERDTQENAYYKGLNFKLYMEREGKRLEWGDGGFVDWLAGLTGNRKERCLISGIGLERVMAIGIKEYK